MHQYRSILFYGLVIFAIFFGSGNLVLPLQIGFASGNNWIMGFIGIFLTGVLLPFSGMLVIKLYKGDYNNFFGEAGIVARICLPFFILSLLGSFGIVPRCITVAHGGMSYVLPHLSLGIFSLIFCIITFFLCLKNNMMFSILGKILSPIKVLALVILILVGIMYSTYTPPEVTALHAFSNGLFTAYQTMDLFAAFFFSSMLFKQVQNAMPQKTSDTEILIFTMKSGVFGFMLLALIYLGLVFLGSHYAFLLRDVTPKMMLPTIAMHIMGNGATIFIACTMFFSCLATAIALNSIYARYICDILKLEDKKLPIILFLTMAVSFAISLLDFGGITAFLIPILEASYPGLIALTVMCLCYRKKHKAKMYIFWIVTILMIWNMV